MSGGRHAAIFPPDDLVGAIFKRRQTEPFFVGEEMRNGSQGSLLLLNYHADRMAVH
jgi:hypothetical protein